MAKKPSTVAFELAKRASAVPSEGSRLKIVVNTTFIDRFEGLSTSETIWGEQPNEKFIEECLSDLDAREVVARFFTSREAAALINKMVPTTSIRPSETAFTKADVVRAVGELIEDSKAASIVLEFVIPSLIKIGLVSANISYSRQVSYGFDRVTVEALRRNVTTYNVIETYKNLKFGLDPNLKVSRSVFAEAFAEAMRPIGLALYEMVDLSLIVDDIVRGVRANVDPVYNADGVSGSVPTEWRTHAIVSELAGNLVFLRAALSMPEGSSMSIMTDGWKLHQWAPVVMTAIKSSDRFALVSKREALRHYELTKVYDVRGEPKAAVLARRVEAAPVAQAVFAMEDSIVTDAYNISATKDRIADVVQSAYGKANFSTLMGAELIADNLRDFIDRGWTGYKSLYMIDAMGSSSSKSDVALFLADHAYVAVTNGVVEVSKDMQRLIDEDDIDNHIASQVWDPVWYFHVPTREKSLRVWSGQHLGDVVITSDPVEVFLAADEFEAVDALPMRPQLLSAPAFNSRLVGFNDKVLAPVNTRFTFKVNALGLEANASFRAMDFASLRSGAHTSLVRPHYNDAVIQGLQAAFAEADAMTNSVVKSTEDDWEGKGKPDATLMQFLKQREARRLLQIAQQLSPSFRAEVHEMIVERSLVHARRSGSDADLYRSRLTQKTFGALADLAALHFFLFLQQIDTQKWEDLMKTEAVQLVCMDTGTDRDQKY